MTIDNADASRFGAAETLDTESTIIERVQEMHEVLRDDRELMTVYRDYVRGNQGDPVSLGQRDASESLLAQRSQMNVIRLAVNIPAQVSYIDGYSRKNEGGDPELDPPEWQVWHKSNMPAKQTRLFNASLTYGAGYTMLSNIGTDDRKIDLLSARNTVCFFEDPVNDVVPAWALTVKTWPRSEKIPGRALYMDAERIVHLEYHLSGEYKVAPNGDQPHDLGMTPCVRWPAVVDDEGAVEGVVGPLIAAQDRVNQVVYAMLSNQSHNAWKLRFASGVAGRPKFDDNGQPMIDGNGDQVYEKPDINPSAWITSEDPEARFGSLDETPQEGFILALQETIKDFAIEAQLPPHSLLGSMSNLSAETLQALMSQTMRFTKMLKGSWGDAARTQMQMIAKDMGNEAGYQARGAEMRWRDTNENTLSAIVDALGKAAEMLGVPGEALWAWFPGVTDSELARWREIKSEQMANGFAEDLETTSSAMRRETAGTAPAEPNPPAGASDVRARARARTSQSTEEVAA